MCVSHAQAPNGLQEVFDKFPKWFNDGYKGKGHEVRVQRALVVCISGRLHCQQLFADSACLASL